MASLKLRSSKTHCASPTIPGLPPCPSFFGTTRNVRESVLNTFSDCCTVWRLRPPTFLFRVFFIPSSAVVVFFGSRQRSASFLRPPLFAKRNCAVVHNRQRSGKWKEATAAPFFSPPEVDVRNCIFESQHSSLERCSEMLWSPHEFRFVRILHPQFHQTGYKVQTSTEVALRVF